MRVREQRSRKHGGMKRLESHLGERPARRILRRRANHFFVRYEES